MAGSPMINKGLGGTFIAALLLTGSAEGAEAAVLEGIRVMEQDGCEGEAFLQGTMAASIASNNRLPAFGEQEHAASLLPAELHRVLRLSGDFRRCFVLRVLVGLSREDCAQLLETEMHRIDELVCASMRALAFLPDEASTPWEFAAAASGWN